LKATWYYFSRASAHTLKYSESDNPYTSFDVRSAFPTIPKKIGAATGAGNLSANSAKKFSSGVYSGSNISFATPHIGQTQSSGTFSNAVPGATPESGSPAAGS
jgi:hypothetical protein